MSEQPSNPPVQKLPALEQHADEVAKAQAEGLSKATSRKEPKQLAAHQALTERIAASLNRQFRPKKK